MNDKELEKIFNFVLNNLGNDACMRLVHLQETAQVYYLKSEALEKKIAIAVNAIQFARMIVGEAGLKGAVEDLNNYLAKISGEA